METTLIVRIILIVTSSLSSILQIVGLVGPAWYGFSLSMEVNGINERTYVEAGLFHLPPFEICVDSGDGPVCETPEQMESSKARQLLNVASTAIHENIAIVRSLALTGLLVSVCGSILLYIYLCLKLKRQRCFGILCAIAWVLAALFEFLATGIQLFRNNETKHSNRLLQLKHPEQHIQIETLVAWAPVILGIGATVAIIVGLFVALTTCGKQFSKTVVIYGKQDQEYGDEVMLEP